MLYLLDIRRNDRNFNLKKEFLQQNRPIFMIFDARNPEIPKKFNIRKL